LMRWGDSVLSYSTTVAGSALRDGRPEWGRRRGRDGIEQDGIEQFVEAGLFGGRGGGGVEIADGGRLGGSSGS